MICLRNEKGPESRGSGPSASRTRRAYRRDPRCLESVFGLARMGITFSVFLDGLYAAVKHNIPKLDSLFFKLSSFQRMARGTGLCHRARVVPAEARELRAVA